MRNKANNREKENKKAESGVWQGRAHTTDHEEKLKYERNKCPEEEKKEEARWN